MDTNWVNPFNGRTPQSMWEAHNTPKRKEVYFENLEGFLTRFKFEPTKLPWRYENESYAIIQVEEWDSYGFPIYTFITKRYDDSFFRGRLLSSEHATHIFWCIAEDYHLFSGTVTPSVEDYPINIQRNVFKD